MTAFAFLYAVIIMNEARIIVFPWKETYVITFIQMISVPLFTLMMMCLKFDFEKWGMTLVKLLSKISYEVYLWHMLILWINQSCGGYKYNNMYDIRFRNYSLGNGTKLVQAEMDN